MSSSICLQVFILGFIIVGGVNAVEGDADVRKNEFSLKKIKEIMPRFNPEEFDCVDIHKQPGLDHPMLKNHKIQLQPTFLRGSNKVSSEGGCPPGKVPVAKAASTHEEDLQAMNDGWAEEHLAVVESIQESGLRGANANIELHNPHPLQNYQFSTASIWVLGGPPSRPNSLQAGWAVHPFLYKDHYTHFTIFWKTDNFVNGCYDARCPGFVQVHQRLKPGLSYSDADVDPRYHTVMEFTIQQDKGSGNWWLYVGQGSLATAVGYWPKEILKHLAGGASQVRYGGYTGNLVSLPSPPMGRGTFPSSNIPRSSILVRLGAFNSSYELVDTWNLSMKTRVDAPKCYNGIYAITRDIDYKALFGYGGPGGSKC